MIIIFRCLCFYAISYIDFTGRTLSNIVRHRERKRENNIFFSTFGQTTNLCSCMRRNVVGGVENISVCTRIHCGNAKHDDMRCMNVERKTRNQRIFLTAANVIQFFSLSASSACFFSAIELKVLKKIALSFYFVPPIAH